MRTHTNLIAKTAFLLLAGLIAGCNSTVDTEPDVVLEVQTLTIPPVTGSITTGTCVFTLTNSTATLKNVPKSSLAGTSPFNDIVMQDVLVTYIWDDGAGVTSAQFGVGATVPAGGTASAQFATVNALDLTTPDRQGHTANLTLTFRGTTVSGDPVSVTTGGSLTVNACGGTPPVTGVCCTPTTSGNPETCAEITQAACAVPSTYQGDGTTCVTDPCPNTP